MDAIVLYRPQETAEEEDQQKETAITGLSHFMEDNQQKHKSGWVGLWWSEHRQRWMLGCCHFLSDLRLALQWYDNQYKTQSRLYRVDYNKVRLRCAKSANITSGY